MQLDHHWLYNKLQHLQSAELIMWFESRRVLRFFCDEMLPDFYGIFGIFLNCILYSKVLYKR